MEFSVTPNSCRACLKVAVNSRLLTDPYAADGRTSSNDTESCKYLDIYKSVIEYAESTTEQMQLPQFFPQTICDYCEAQLIVAYEFRTKSMTSERILQNILNKYYGESLSAEKDETIINEQYCETLDDSIVEFCENDTMFESFAQNEDGLQEKPEASSIDGTVGGQLDDNHDTITTCVNASYLQIEHDYNAIKKNEDSDYVIEFLEYEQDSESNEDFNADSDDMKPQESKHKTSQCQVCGKIVSMRYLAKHKETHTDKANRMRPHQCDQCKACFTLKENLYKHKRIHSNDKRYTCPFCKEQFLHWASRRYHIASHHTGEKKFACEYCGGKFRNSSQYAIHIRRHTGVTPYPCHICDRRFITGNSLKMHLLSHSDSKNYHCDICQKSYKSSKTLRLHRKTLHEQERNYRCPLCERAFSQNHVLRTHLLRNHPEYDPPQPGTVVNLRAVERMNEQMSKLNADS
ncbi:zinc finger protein 436-like [Toxorhynchites rutilus septentrionalis]|uniref:zinc finger protein 436-like n=1 Tax=Toxorhynchites rutilus septentrionalis TaxID=329112 RepID=UPI0024789EE9|nr:zinc finger protein 436-like [Toxorhynchites rutilus septentrionalis]